jgi:circadian clock protein KaiC
MLYHGMKVVKVRDSAFTPVVTKLIIPNGPSGSFSASGGVVTGDSGRPPA